MKRLLCHWRIDAETSTRAREARRLYLLALASRGLGWSPHLFVSRADISSQSDFATTSGLRQLVGLFDAIAQRPNEGDVVLCACNPGDVPCKVVYTNPTMNADKDVDAAKFANVMLSRCRGRRDYYRTPGNHITDIEADQQLHVPHVPHDGVLRQLETDGMVDALLSNDLEMIRAAYQTDEPTLDIDFCGVRFPWRTSILQGLAIDNRISHVWTDGGARRLQPKAYLQRLARCASVLDLPGERWITYRFTEAVLMGAAVVHSREAPEISPAVTTENSIRLQTWGDSKSLGAGIQNTERIVKAADQSYRDGWSFLGQIKQALARLE